MDPLPCSRCGHDAYATVEPDGGYAWYGSAHDADHFVTVDRSLQMGAVCDECLEGLIGAGKVVVSWKMDDGFSPPSSLGLNGATALFLRGFRHALERSERDWETGETRGVAFRDGRARSFDGTLDPVPLPGWMAASGRLWRAFSAATDRRDNDSDFEALGALYFMVTRTRVEDVGASDLREAAQSAFERESAIEAQLVEARATREEFVNDLVALSARRLDGSDRTRA